MSLDLTDDKSLFRQWLGVARQQAITSANVDQIYVAKWRR